ncbi:hypothetical protein C6P45_003225, partial [Maudiozyma exigua]
MESIAFKDAYSSYFTNNTDNFDNWRIGLSNAFAVIRIELYEYCEKNGVVTTIPPQVSADPTLYQSVLRLLDNAIKTAIINSSEPEMQDV